ncbi:MAG: ABC transporter substrate-binding protein [Alphaproteobacteria bacterium]|nr:ABC transporter substrate-binding protein [Alphaproteobacteria bacterium]MBV9150325.1 ABC transporter substrate-binding protein [Alphaproteobacteria bacterium]MBV9586657.1 ABC transporter substrate-binding protein [Alphaproteobacteria bacterium]MBV9968137.1 ABC transporter substrate-binding protein [Alphaproteobacteria bacterium]
MADTVVKVGLINSYTGFVAQAGDLGQKGIDLYVKQHEKDLPPGVKIELIRRDDTSNPEVGKRLAQELIARDHVQLLAGLVLSPVAAAIAPLTAEAKVPLLISIAAAGVQIPRISPYIARVTFTLWQQCYPIGKWAVTQNWKTAYTAVTDFIAGHDSEAAFTKGFTDGGGKIVGAVRFPPTNPDFVPFVQRIKDAKPDLAFLWVPAQQQAIAMIKAVRDLGLREAGIQIASVQDLLPDEALPNMGDTPLGLISAGTYSVAGKRPANDAFLAAWKEAYGAESIPDFFSVDGYDAMAAIFDLVKATNGNFTGDEAMAFFKNWKRPDSPRGPIAIDPETRDIIQNVYMRRVEKVNGQLANVEFETIPQVKDPWKELNPEKK